MKPLVEQASQNPPVEPTQIPIKPPKEQPSKHPLKSLANATKTYKTSNREALTNLIKPSCKNLTKQWTTSHITLTTPQKSFHRTLT